MNYMQARKLSDDSGWHVTVRNDDQIWTHSCCRTQVPATEDDVARLDWIYQGSLKVGDLIDGPSHDPHSTREQAEECYHQWRLRKIETSLVFDDAVFGDWTGCRAEVGRRYRPGFGPKAIVVHDHEGQALRCDTPTKGGARYRDDHHPEQLALCPEHRKPEIVLGQVGRVTSSIYS